MYQDDSEIMFTTLVLGEHYRNIVSTQIQSILKFTNNNLYIITDEINYFGNYYPSRVKFIDFNTITKMPLKGKQGMFNYNLKLVPIKWVFEHINPALCVYMDADSFLFGWNKSFFRAFNPRDYGMYGRFRHGLNEHSSDVVIPEKLKQMGIDASNISTQVPIENIMFWKNGPQVLPCLHQWEHFAEIAYDTGARTDFEAVELALALNASKCPYINIATDQRYNIEDFRTLHNGSIHIPFIL